MFISTPPRQRHCRHAPTGGLCLINAVTVHVGPSTQVTDNPTYQVEPLRDGAIFLYDNSPFTRVLLVLFSQTGRKVRVTDTGSTVPAEPRNTRHSVAHYNQPSAHPQERPQYEIQNSVPWYGRSRDS